MASVTLHWQLSATHSHIATHSAVAAVWIMTSPSSHDPSDYFINCPAFISTLPIPPNNQPFYPDQQTHHRSFVDSKDLLPALKEPLFFDDWAAANFKVINLPPDWLAAHQSPYQILRSDPSVPQMVQGYLEERKRRDSTFLQEYAVVFLPALRLFA
ncbi:transcription factor Sp5 [Tachysurus ichikawai]